ncbi:hypothetical protein GLOIN_2v1489035 [Rhizophagus irregularis DAOM 181602=DAOM 197198]|uniref:Uncharacterized protein n=3 Tax=Rhizophagus irregularis TaxID=588596 RepID=A0A2N1NA01_9GLOM|nr:hypothetical protein GLOIN_2v1489035 [Rhizophagus irregularis DAOM 181602=DAOM 197198]EXX58173.1 hypothetical protein RirG_200330 [Rhizophagus irregularis DAOM 197198w]PKK70698.1 hypothetical protein RhiirC2_745935 [Rhizophagus irregularis]POG57861.1 hypothetical protein GLOIN_2v1489035 [Rhizophagus irregularis DAOM 181602=DAOM 197198]|eukprot:XP_025164727.1 hypothetical protein GLOIN_2v1489035 [Rhizophagus irregularis DAOM 181602=DAOM 197198]
MTCKARKVNKLFGYEYDPVTLKKIKGIGRHMAQRVTCSADSISRFTNPQIDYIIEQVNSKTITDQSSVDEIFETVATTSIHDSDDNFSNTSDDTVYFKEGTNESIEEVSKKSEVNASTKPTPAKVNTLCFNAFGQDQIIRTMATPIHVMMTLDPDSNSGDENAIEDITIVTEDTKGEGPQ